MPHVRGPCRLFLDAPYSTFFSVVCRLDLEAQIAERERQLVEEEAEWMNRHERDINADLLRKAVAANIPCCICGQCPDCCAWQQTKLKASR